MVYRIWAYVLAIAAFLAPIFTDKNDVVMHSVIFTGVMVLLFGVVEILEKLEKLIEQTQSASTKANDLKT